jgi:hypothetical protein
VELAYSRLSLPGFCTENQSESQLCRTQRCNMHLFCGLLEARDLVAVIDMSR